MRAFRLILRRLLAYAIDVFLLAAILLPLATGAALLLGAEAVTGPQVWARQLVLVSAPAWCYFIVTDHAWGGRSVGKRVLGLRTREEIGEPPSWSSAIARTALKLLPWELVHVGFFALSASFDRVAPHQLVVAGTAYALMLLYFVVAYRHGGTRSLPDLVAGTRVEVA
jgi:uncharacterized RDD family membrane protein YckC